MNHFEAKIAHFIDTHQLMSLDKKYLVALSGGADSVALLLVLKQLGYQIEAVHCNFHLRNKESERDETFCEQLCKQKNIPFHRVHFDTLSYAALHHVSIEMAARNLRYTYFLQLMKDLGCHRVCVAHHSNDNVETFLINLIRGTGIAGLTGIPVKNECIIRPLLNVSKEDILLYLSSLHQEFVTDSTNLKPEVVRNKIRLDILPALEKINPKVNANILKTISYLKEYNKVLNKALSESVLRVFIHHAISIQALKAEPSPELVLFTILQPYGFNSVQIKDVAGHLYSNVVGKEYRSASHIILLGREQIKLYALKDLEFNPVRIPEPGIYAIAAGRKLKVTIDEMGDFATISKDKAIASIDADKVKYPLTVRTPKQGERFYPFGMQQSRLISDFLTDIKKNKIEKQHQWIVVDSDDRVVWIVGERIDNRFRIGADTNRMLSIVEIQ